MGRVWVQEGAQESILAPTFRGLAWRFCSHVTLSLAFHGPQWARAAATTYDTTQHNNNNQQPHHKHIPKHTPVLPSHLLSVVWTCFSPASVERAIGVSQPTKHAGAGFEGVPQLHSLWGEFSSDQHSSHLLQRAGGGAAAACGCKVAAICITTTLACAMTGVGRQAVHSSICKGHSWSHSAPSSASGTAACFLPPPLCTGVLCSHAHTSTSPPPACTSGIAQHAARTAPRQTSNPPLITCALTCARVQVRPSCSCVLVAHTTA